MIDDQPFKTIFLFGYVVVDQRLLRGDKTSVISGGVFGFGLQQIAGCGGDCVHKCGHFLYIFENLCELRIKCKAL